VLRSDFIFPIPDIELAIPLAPDKDPWRYNRDTTNFIRVLARAKRGATHAQIADDLGSIANHLKQEFPKSYERKRGVLVVPYHAELTRNFSQALWVQLGAVGLVLLIACANLANLMLVRGTERRKEIAIRQALGASRGRLAQQMLTESMLLAAGGGILGVLLAQWAVPALVALSPAAMPRAQAIGISLPVLLFTMGVAALAGLVFGLLPAWRASRVDLNEDLKSETRGAGGGVERARIRGTIVAAQLAVMVMLLAGAGLLWKSFREVMRVNAGFDSNVLTVRLSLPRKDYTEVAKISRFSRELESRVAALPGVRAAGTVSQIPLNGALASADYRVADRPPSEGQIPTAQYRAVTPEYFRAMGIPLLAGRAFTEDDTPAQSAKIIISESIAKLNFPDRNPIGQRLLVDDTSAGFRPLEIVGVVGDVRHSSLEETPLPHMYIAYHQMQRDLLVWVTANQYLVVRADGDPATLAKAVRHELQTVDANVAAANIRTTDEYLRAATVARRFNLLLVSIFAGLALLMAAIGIYGVLSYSVSQRTREIGVRMALGAQMASILGLVLGEGMKRAGVGIAVGVGAAVASSRAMRSMLYGVDATDVPTYALAVLVLLGVALLACLVPAWRAARVNPIIALRNE